jgi:hypothetical protein
MITAARQARKLATSCGISLAITVLLCATTTAQQKPSYQVIAPDIVAQGEEFTIRVVENTDAGQLPIQAGKQIAVNETMLTTEEGGKVRVPAWTREMGNQFLVIDIQAGVDQQNPPAPPIQQHVEVVRLSQQPGQLPPRIWRISETAPSGGNLRVDGQALNSLRNASLQGNGGAYPLNDSVGSSLQQTYRCPKDLPKGSYHFVAQDASGHSQEAPNATTNPTLTITGTKIRRRGQRGQFVVSSDVEADVQLSGGEPNIQLDVRTVHVNPNRPGTVSFTALQVGNYNMDAQMATPDAPPPDAPRADANVGKLLTSFNSGEGKTTVSAPITINDPQGQPVANIPIDVALVGPQGIQCIRLTTDKNGQANFQTSLPGQVPADELKLHCFRVLGHRWNKQPQKQRRRRQSYEYAVKFVCGSPELPVVAPGQYFTAINVHNPGELPALFQKKVAVALPGERAGPVSRFYEAQLRPDQALEIDCPDILGHAQAHGFLKGFVVIESPVELDVVAVYSAGHPQVETLDMERVRPRVVSPAEIILAPTKLLPK